MRVFVTGADAWSRSVVVNDLIAASQITLFADNRAAPSAATTSQAPRQTPWHRRRDRDDADPMTRFFPIREPGRYRQTGSVRSREHKTAPCCGFHPGVQERASAACPSATVRIFPFSLFSRIDSRRPTNVLNRSRRPILILNGLGPPRIVKATDTDLTSPETQTHFTDDQTVLLLRPPRISTSVIPVLAGGQSLL
jgi:hypothetical protein